MLHIGTTSSSMKNRELAKIHVKNAGFLNVRVEKNLCCNLFYRKLNIRCFGDLQTF